MQPRVRVSRHGSVSIGGSGASGGRFSAANVDALASSLLQRNVMQQVAVAKKAGREAAQSGGLSAQYERILVATQSDRDATFQRLQEEEARSRALQQELADLKARTHTTLGRMRTSIQAAKTTVEERVAQRDAVHAEQTQQLEAALATATSERSELAQQHGQLQSAHATLRTAHSELRSEHDASDARRRKAGQQRAQKKKATQQQQQRPSWSNTLRGERGGAAGNDRVLDFGKVSDEHSRAPWRSTLRSTLPRSPTRSPERSPPRGTASDSAAPSVHVSRHGSVSIGQSQPSRSSPSRSPSSRSRLLAAKYAAPRQRSASPQHSPAFGSSVGMDRGELPRFHDAQQRPSVWMGDRSVNYAAAKPPATSAATAAGSQVYSRGAPAIVAPAAVVATPAAAPSVHVSRHGSVSIGQTYPQLQMVSDPFATAAPTAAPAAAVDEGDSDSDSDVHNIYGEPITANAASAASLTGANGTNAQLLARINRFGSINLSPRAAAAPAQPPAPAPARMAANIQLPSVLAVAPAAVATPAAAPSVSVNRHGSVSIGQTYAAAAPAAAPVAAPVAAPSVQVNRHGSVSIGQTHAATAPVAAPVAVPSASSVLSPSVHIDRNGRITITPLSVVAPEPPLPQRAAARSPIPLPSHAGSLAYTDVLSGMDIQRAFAEIASAKDVRGNITRDNFLAAILMHVDASHAAAINKTLLSRVFDALASDTDPDVALALRLASGICMLCVDNASGAARAVFDLHDTSRTGIMTKLEVERFLSAVYAVASLVNAEFKTAMSGTEEQCAKSVATAHFQRLDAHRGYSISFTEFKDWYLSAPSAGEPMHHRSLAPFTYVVGRALALALATAASFKTTLTALERAGVGAAQAYAAAQIASISMGRAAQTRRQILPTAAPEQYTASPLQRAMAVTSTATPAPASARMLRIGGGRSPDAQRIRGAVAAAEVQRAAADDARARNLDYDALTKDPRSVRVNRHGSISIGGGGSNLDAQRIDDAVAAAAAQRVADAKAQASALADARARVLAYSPPAQQSRGSTPNAQRIDNAIAAAANRRVADEQAQAAALAAVRARAQSFASPAQSPRSNVRVNRHGSISINGSGGGGLNLDAIAAAEAQRAADARAQAAAVAAVRARAAATASSPGVRINRHGSISIDGGSSNSGKQAAEESRAREEARASVQAQAEDRAQAASQAMAADLDALRAANARIQASRSNVQVSRHGSVSITSTTPQWRMPKDSSYP